MAPQIGHKEGHKQQAGMLSDRGTQASLSVGHLIEGPYGLPRPSQRPIRTYKQAYHPGGRPSRGYSAWKNSPMRGTLRPPPPKPMALLDLQAKPTIRADGHLGTIRLGKIDPCGGPYGLPRPSHRGKLRSPPTDPQACHPGSDGPPRASRGNSTWKNCPAYGGPCGLPRIGRHRFPQIIANKTTLCCPHIKSTATNGSS